MFFTYQLNLLLTSQSKRYNLNNHPLLMLNTMKRLIMTFTCASLIAALVITSCRNKEDLTPDVSDSEMSVTSTQASDNENVTSSIDDALNNINASLNTNAGARTEACGYTVNYSGYSTVSGSNQKTVVFTFQKLDNCGNGRYREGTITVTLITGNHFSDEGAVYTVAFDGYGVTYNGNKVMLSGTQTVTNTTGGLPESGTVMVKHTVTGEMHLTFNNSNTSRDWQINREITWTYSDGVLSYSITSNNTVEGYTNTSVWGTNRFGNKFYTQILSPISANSSCGWYRPTSGERKHTLEDTDGSVLFTANAKVNTGSDGCGNGFTITTINKRGKTRTLTVTY